MGWENSWKLCKPSTAPLSTLKPTPYLCFDEAMLTRKRRILLLIFGNTAEPCHQLLQMQNSASQYRNSKNNAKGQLMATSLFRSLNNSEATRWQFPLQNINVQEIANAQARIWKWFSPWADWFTRKVNLTNPKERKGMTKKLHHWITQFKSFHWLSHHHIWAIKIKGEFTC